MLPPDMQPANNVANVLFGSVWSNVVLIKVDAFTIFDTMESMKGHKCTGNQGEQFKMNCNTTLFLQRLYFGFCHSFRWYQFKPGSETRPGSEITTPNSVKLKQGDYAWPGTLWLRNGTAWAVVRSSAINMFDLDFVSSFVLSQFYIIEN